MATLKDLYSVYCELVARINFSGATFEWVQKFDKLVKAVRSAVMEEQGLDSPDKLATLPKDTVLGEKAQAALADLKALLPPGPQE